MMGIGQHQMVQEIRLQNSFNIFWIKGYNYSEVRVMERAKSGGHYVPLYEIQRNYFGNLYQLNKRFKSIDDLQIVDTSESVKPRVLALFKKGNVESAVHHGKLADWFEKYLPALYKKIISSEPPKQFPVKE